jgi:hypothetical protein
MTPGSRRLFPVPNSQTQPRCGRFVVSESGGPSAETGARDTRDNGRGFSPFGPMIFSAGNAARMCGLHKAVLSLHCARRRPDRRRNPCRNGANRLFCFDDLYFCSANRRGRSFGNCTVCLVWPTNWCAVDVRNDCTVGRAKTARRLPFHRHQTLRAISNSARRSERPG